MDKETVLTIAGSTGFGSVMTWLATRARARYGYKQGQLTAENQLRENFLKSEAKFRADLMRRVSDLERDLKVEREKHEEERRILMGRISALEQELARIKDSDAGLKLDLRGPR